jgi:plastocyanin
MARRARSELLIGLLLAICGLTTTVSLAAPAQRARHHARHAAKPCRRTRRHHCRARSHKKRAANKRKPASVPTPPKPASGSSAEGPTGPWGPLPPAVGPGASTTPAPGSAGATAPPEAPSNPAPAAHVEVTAEDTQAFRFVLSRPSVPAGRVIIEFINHGQDEHNMHVLEASEGAEAGAIANTAPNAHPSLALELRHGAYTFFCSLPGHEAAGMKATLVVN